jgi:hypothetical protein
MGGEERRRTTDGREEKTEGEGGKDGGGKEGVGGGMRRQVSGPPQGLKKTINPGGGRLLVCTVCGYIGSTHIHVHGGEVAKW